MELLLNIVNGWKPLTILEKNFILDIWLGSEYASAWNTCEQLPLRKKVFKYGVFSSPYFPVFGPNTGKYGPEKTPYLNTFLRSVPLFV